MKHKIEGKFRILYEYYEYLWEYYRNAKHIIETLGEGKYGY